MISLKDKTVNPRGLTPEALLGIMITKSVMEQYDSRFVITSLNDGKHKRSSSHYSGNAWDIRIWYIKEHLADVVEHMQQAVGIHYDIILESDHIHCQYKPKRED